MTNEQHSSNNNLKRELAALCYLAVTITYIVTNTVPYAPFLAVQLLPGRATHENVGKYSAFFTSCYIWGRSSGAGVWGSLADSRGRLPVLYAQLALGGLFTLLFGLSNHYLWALAMRFFTGLFCDVVSILKTIVSELAEEDRQLEAQSMNLVVSAWAIGSLLAPALGGALSDPLKQWPQLVERPLLRAVLERFPFLLPNLLGSLLCAGGILVTRFCLRETLPCKTQTQQFTGELLEDNTKTDVSGEDPTPDERQSLLWETSALQYGMEPNSGFEMIISPEAIELAYEKDLQEIMRDSYLFSDDLEGVVTSPEFRKSMAVSIYKRGSQQPTHPLSGVEETKEEGANQEPPKPNWRRLFKRQLKNPEATVEEGKEPLTAVPTKPTTLMFLLDADTRNHLIVLCIGMFIIHFQMEAFPLFCLSPEAGLGVSEATIGGIMAASGIVHALLQPSIYGCILGKTGLKGSVRWAATAIVPVFFLIPFSLLSQGVGDDSLRWTALTFLGVLVGMGRIFTVTFVSSMAVSLNHLVVPEHRATFNGLLTRIGGGCKGAAPIMAGFFVAWAFSSGVVPPGGWGALLLYFCIGLVGILLAAASHLLLGADDESF